MGWRVGSAMLLAALLAGCSENRLLTGSLGQSDYAMVTPGSMTAQADPSFRVNELRPGLSKAELQAMYPGRLAFDSGDDRKELYFVEPLGVAPQTRPLRDRLVLWLNDGRLATFEVMRTDEAVALAATAQAPAATPPVGKFGVQIAARRSEAEARAAIDEMRARFPSLLGHEWATINRVSLPQGVFYRVMVGPLRSAQQAAQLCSSLKAQGAACFIRGT
jgi:hypothetical protein